MWYLFSTEKIDIAEKLDSSIGFVNKLYQLVVKNEEVIKYSNV